AALGTLRKAGILAPSFSITNLYVHYAVTRVLSAPTETALNFASPLREPVWQRCRTPGLIARGLSENRQQVKGIFATGLWPHCYVAEHRDFSSPPTRPVLHQRRNTDFPQARVRRRRIRGEAILQ